MRVSCLFQSWVFGFAAIAMPLAYAQAAPKPTQYVVISFDGAREIEQWQRSRNLAREAGANFTYFLSCVYLLTPETKQLYKPPRHRAGSSNVGFGASRDDVAERLRQIWATRREGHEIASHGCGHFDGAAWNASDWAQEFDAFSSVLRDAWTNNAIPFEPAEWAEFAAAEVTGFRSPYLSVGPALGPALRDHGFTHDASGVSRGPVEPVDESGLVEFSLPLVPEGPKAKPVIAMDYNLYVRHSDAEEKPELASAFEGRAYGAFLAAFEREYTGGRTPLQIGFHFRLMNDGAYWRALERFARDTCRMQDVRCVSYRELADIISPPITNSIATDSASATATSD